MLLLALIISISSSCFFYCQAIMGGLGRKRWAFAGLCFGPLVWPMFNMKKRVKVYRKYGLNGLLFSA